MLSRPAHIAVRSVILATVLAAASGCQSYVAVPVQPATLVAVQQHSQVKVTTKADILFVVDDSLSMSQKQDRLAQALANFTAALDALDPPVDYQAAVVTTSIFERFGACAPDGNASAAAQCGSDWGASGFACKTAACVRVFPDEAGQLRQAPGAPARVLRRGDTTAAQFSQWLGEAVQAGSSGARQPQGLQAMKLAISDAKNGFVRDGAKVVVAFVTDAEDCSDPSQRMSMLVKDGQGNVIDKCAADSASTNGALTSLEPVAAYVNFLRTLKDSNGSPKEIEVAALVSLQNGTRDPGLCTNSSCVARCDQPPQQQQCQATCAGSPTFPLCMADCTAACKTFCGGQVPGRRYVEMATAFSGLTANICADDASDPLQRLAKIVGIPAELPLLAPPSSPELLRVSIQRGGGTVECVQGQGYDLVQTADGPVVRLQGSCRLQPDDVWDLRYLTNG
jgi:hypothetical protein